MRKRRLGGCCAAAVLGAAVCLLPGRVAFGLPSFPGAEGFGAIATGGRGGQVLKVTTLASSGPGSLQWALDQSGPRIIVFEVSGVIEGDHTVNQGDVTIAGQTAPGAGITIAGRFWGKYSTTVQNIIVRHLRIRPEHNGEPGNQFDAVQFSRNARVMLDHLSIAWGIDENVDLYEADDITVQWSSIEESSTSGHPEGSHNYGLINGPDGHRISVHHNLFAHHKNRCPAIANGPADVRNNVVYNVRHGFVHHNPATGFFNIVGNVYIQGPNDTLIPFYFDDEGSASPSTQSYHLSDNYIDDPSDYVGVVNNPWQTPYKHPSFASMNLPSSFYEPMEHDYTGQPGYVPISMDPSQQLTSTLLPVVGAFPRDAVTARTVQDVSMRTGSWGKKAQSNLMQGLTPTAPPADLDDDGMADSWETSHGLDPADPNDHDTLMPSGYTAIEDYINELADALIGIAPPPPGGEGGGGGQGGSGEGGSAQGGAGGEGGAGGSGSPSTSASGSSGSGASGSGGGGGGSGDDDGADCNANLAGGRSDAFGVGLAMLLALALRRRRQERGA